MDKTTVSTGMPSEEDEDEYVVEKILKHRTTKRGELQYFLKWKGFSDGDNTWEPANNLNCPDLVEIYEKEKAEKKLSKTKVKTSSKVPVNINEPKLNGVEDDNKNKTKRKHADDSSSKKKKKTEKRLTGFDKGLEAEEILGATETTGEVHFLIKWKNVNDAELVPSKIANVKIPQMVIAFYEARLTWSASNKSSDETAEETEEDTGKNKENEEMPVDQCDA